MSDIEKPRGRGRPCTYANAAERARAWRQRQKALIAQAQQQTEPVVIEKIVEKLIEVPATPGRRRPLGESQNQLEASRLLAVLQDRFDRYGGEDTAKRLRTNASKVAGAAREILSMLDHKIKEPAAEHRFLRDVADFFESLSGQFEVAQRGAKRAKAQREAESKVRRELEIANTVRTIFGEPIDPEKVRAISSALFLCSSLEYRAAEARRLGVDSVFFSMDRASELQAALKGNNIPRAAALVAETRLSLEEQGKRTIYRGKTYYDLGWRDIEHFRSNENTPIPKAEGVSNP